MKKALMFLSVSVLLVVVFAPPASAQFWSTRPIDKSTYLTFSGPVSLPDVTLPAGTYVFHFVEPIRAPGVLMVMSEDRKTSYAMLFTIPIVRTETESNKSDIVTFRETPTGAPAQIGAWFFDAEDTPVGREDVGCELIYSR
jgi:hypothetical protein